MLELITAPETPAWLVDKANVRNYKSNQRAFTFDRWRYNEEKPTHIALEFRLVLQSLGGIEVSYGSHRGLSEYAADFIGDLLTVAYNLGFNCDTADQRISYRGREAWHSGSKEIFYTHDGEPLIEVKGYLNRNVHMRLNQDFALALNVEVGRLRGWVKSGAEAAEEFNDPKAAAVFNTNLQLGPGSLLMLAA